MSQSRKREHTMKRTAAIAVTVVAVLGVTSSLAGAAGARRAPVPYAPGSEYVYSSSGAKLGTLTGQNLTAQFNTVQGLVSR
jgi:hypothetical protein